MSEGHFQERRLCVSVMLLEPEIRDRAVHQRQLTPNQARLVTMLYGQKLIHKPWPTPKFFAEGWGIESTKLITDLLTEGSMFMTYLYMDYERLVRFANLNVFDTWGQSGNVGSIVIHGAWVPDYGDEQTIIKVGNRNTSVHLLSEDYLRSFGPKPRREVAFNGGQRFHKMWWTALIEIGTTFLHGEGEITQHSFPDIVKQGFSSLSFDELVVVRDIRPASQQLEDPDVQYFN